MSKSLVDQIREAGELDDKAPYKHGWVIDSNGEQEQCEWTYIRCKEAMKHQHAQSAWMREALLIAMGKINQTMSHLNNYAISGNEALCLIRRDTEDALTEIAALVPKVEK